MDNLDNKLDWSITREQVEQSQSRPLTDKEWVVVASEIENIIDHYVWLDIQSVFDNLADLVAEHDKWDALSQTDSI